MSVGVCVGACVCVVWCGVCVCVCVCGVCVGTLLAPSTIAATGADRPLAGAHLRACVCLCACVRACVRVCVRACVCVCVRVRTAYSECTATLSPG